MAMYLGSNKVEIGASSSGGGSSDFSTAEVTFNLTYPEGAVIDVEAIGGLILPWPVDITDTFNSKLEVNFVALNNHSLVIPLYQGKAYFSYWTGEDDTNYTNYYNEEPTGENPPILSGDVEVVYINYNYYYKVTGDCSITSNMIAG